MGTRKTCPSRLNLFGFGVSSKTEAQDRVIYFQPLSCSQNSPANVTKITVPKHLQPIAVMRRSLLYCCCEYSTFDHKEMMFDEPLRINPASLMVKAFDSLSFSRFLSQFRGGRYALLIKQLYSCVSMIFNGKLVVFFCLER